MHEYCARCKVVLAPIMTEDRYGLQCRDVRSTTKKDKVLERKLA